MVLHTDAHVLAEHGGELGRLRRRVDGGGEGPGVGRGRGQNLASGRGYYVVFINNSAYNLMKIQCHKLLLYIAYKIVLLGVAFLVQV